MPDLWETTLNTTLNHFKVEDDKGIFGGHAAKFGEVPFAGGPRGGTFLSKGAFKRTLNNRNKPFPVLWNHDTDKPIGSTLKINEDSVGLRFQAQLNLDLDLAKEVFSNIKAGVVDEMSIGFTIKKSLFDEDTESETIKEVQLFEISPVTIAANPDATITEVMSAIKSGEHSESDIVEMIMDSGIDTEKLIQALSVKDTSNDTLDTDSHNVSNSLPAHLLTEIMRARRSIKRSNDYGKKRLSNMGWEA